MDYCKYRDGCEGRVRFVQAGRGLDILDNSLCNNTRPRCEFFYGYERLNRDSQGVAIGVDNIRTVARGVM